MLVFEDGAGMGTVGGGCVEADIWREATYALADGNGRLISVDLVDDLKGEGDVCGGTVNVFIDVWPPGGTGVDGRCRPPRLPLSNSTAANRRSC